VVHAQGGDHEVEGGIGVGQVGDVADLQRRPPGRAGHGHRRRGAGKPDRLERGEVVCLPRSPGTHALDGLADAKRAIMLGSTTQLATRYR
jgi:hypothetical protein